jgi:hypothetical protein
MNIIMNIRRGGGAHKRKQQKWLRTHGGMCAQENVINTIMNVRKDDNHDHEHKKKARIVMRIEKGNNHNQEHEKTTTTIKT